MKATLTVENPNSIQLTLKITLSLPDWRRILEIHEASPKANGELSYDFRSAITSAVSKATEHFSGTEEEVSLP